MRDARFLRSDQYRDGSNLAARAELHRRFSVNPQGLHRWIFEHLELSPHGRMLEVGCGPGYLWRENSERIPPGWGILLSDLSAGMTHEARRSLPGLRFRLLAADAQAIPFPPRSFDVVIASLVLHHAAEPRTAIADMGRILQPGGNLYIVATGRHHLQELIDLFDRLAPELGWGQRQGEFALEKARGILGGSFRDVVLHPYPDELRITQAEPILDYARSWGQARQILQGDRAAAFRQDVSSELERQGGCLRVTKEVGLLVAKGAVDG